MAAKRKASVKKANKNSASGKTKKKNKPGRAR
jgi:hypothetical protein